MGITNKQPLSAETQEKIKKIYEYIRAANRPVKPLELCRLIGVKTKRLESIMLNMPRLAEDDDGTLIIVDYYGE